MDLQSENTEWAARLRGHFVKTNSNTGLTPHNADLAIRLMNKQQGQPVQPPRRPSGSAPDRFRSAPSKGLTPKGFNVDSVDTDGLSLRGRSGRMPPSRAPNYG